ncbi:MAG: hypothetical protein HRT93_03380 [Piscirickettsiaceae bacterium]|nr:hypothetical protein [Piscirickettsiaceae bacterium]
MAKEIKDIDLYSWIMVVQQLPVGKQYRPLLLGIYLAKPSKYFVEGYFTDYADPTYGDYSDFTESYKTGRGYSRGKLKFLNKHSALRALYRYKNGDRTKLDEGIEEFFDGLDELPNPEVQMTIISENGQVDIQPHEYSMLSQERFKEYHACIGDEYSVGFFDGKEEGNEEFENKMFYMRTRGLSQQKCIELMMGDITSQQVCYLKPHPELAKSMGFV